MEAQRRHPLLGVAAIGRQARHVHQVSDHGGCGLFTPGTRAAVQRRAGCIAVHQHAVHGAVHLGQQLVCGQQGGVHTQLHATGLAAGDAQ